MGDDDLSAEEYASPERAVRAFISGLGEHNATDEIKVLDAACGTGLVGEHLAKSSILSRLTIDGFDISEGMLKVCSKQRRLPRARSGRPSQASPSRRRQLRCCHLRRNSDKGSCRAKSDLLSSCRVITSGGMVVLTVHGEIWDSMGYKVEVDSLSTDNIVKILSSTEIGFLKSTSTGGKLIVLRKC
jgi:SAM-dependent methyltransferase